MITITLVNIIPALEEEELRVLLKNISIIVYVYHEEVFKEEGVTAEDLIQDIHLMSQDQLEKVLTIILEKIGQGLSELEREKMIGALNSLVKEGCDDKRSVCRSGRYGGILH